MWPSEGTQLLVGSKSTQPAPGHQAEHQACEASAPTRRGRPGGGMRAQIAAHIARRQAQRPQAGDLQMGEILADAAALFEECLDRRGDLGRLGVETEILV